jgi:hypothetical protein
MARIWQWIGDHLTGLVALAVLISSRLNAEKLKALHIDLNSRLTQLLTATGAAERAQGVSEGRQLGIDEHTNRTTESERVEDRQAEIHRTTT